MEVASLFDIRVLCFVTQRKSINNIIDGPLVAQMAFEEVKFSYLFFLYVPLMIMIDGILKMTLVIKSFDPGKGNMGNEILPVSFHANAFQLPENIFAKLYNAILRLYPEPDHSWFIRTSEYSGIYNAEDKRGGNGCCVCEGS